MKVLIVEDDKALRSLIAGAVRLEFAGSVVYEASSISEATNVLAHQEEISIAVIDIILPNGRGWALVEQLWSIHKVPVVAMSGHSDYEELQWKCFQNRDCSFIQKPFRLSDLLDRIKLLTHKCDNKTVVEVLNRLRKDYDGYSSDITQATVGYARS